MWETSLALFPVEVHTVVYERMIEDPESELRTGDRVPRLKWNAQMLDHQRTAKGRGVITTASYAQVTEPIYALRRPVAALSQASRAHPAGARAVGREVRLRDLTDGRRDPRCASGAGGRFRRPPARAGACSSKRPRRPRRRDPVAEARRHAARAPAIRSWRCAACTALWPSTRWISPALLMRASLLQRLGELGRPAEAWGMRSPKSPTPSCRRSLAQVVAQAEERDAAWLDERERECERPWPPPRSAPTPNSAAGIERFRNNVLRRTRAYHSAPTDFHYPGPGRARIPSAPAVPVARRARSRDRGHRRRDSSGHGRRARRARALHPICRPRAARSVAPAQQKPRLDRDPLVAERRPDRRQCAIIARARWRCSKPCDQPHVRGAAPNAMFSLLAPNTAIPPHVGVNNARLVCHLPLIVPDGCWFRVGAETRYWRGRGVRVRRHHRA